MNPRRIYWTSPAKKDLRLIKQYYKDTAGAHIAQKIAHDIAVYLDILKTHPQAGQEEENLKPLKERHRYLVKGNYKIIYKILDDSVFITHVFDSRQNPKKLIKGK